MEKPLLFLSPERRVAVGQEGFFHPRERENKKQIKCNIKNPRRSAYCYF